MKDIHVRFMPCEERLGVNVFIFWYVGRKVQYVSAITDQTMQMETVEDEGQVVKALYIPQNIFDELKNEIFKKYKPENSTFVEGEIEATKKHLEDMRTLLKLKK